MTHSPYDEQHRIWPGCRYTASPVVPPNGLATAAVRVRGAAGSRLSPNANAVANGVAGTDAGVPGEGTAPREHQLDRTRRSGEPAAAAAKARRHRQARGQRSTACPLLRVGLVLSLGAVADVPDVTVRVRERTAVPAPLQLRRGLEDRPAGLPGLVQNFVDAVLAAHDVIEHDAAEAAALPAHAHHVGEPVAAIEADQRTAVRNEEHRDLVVVLDLPAQPFRVEPLGSLHVLDTEEDRAHVRVHALSPLGFGRDAHDRHATCGPVTRASRFLTGWVTRFATHEYIPAGRWTKTQRQTTATKQAGPKPGWAAPVLRKVADSTSPRARPTRTD